MAGRVLAMDLVDETDEDSASSVGSLSPLLHPATFPPDFKPDLTKYAERYGASKHEYFKNTGKSGISPISPPNPFFPQSPRKLRRARLEERIQRKRLTDFASWELKDSGSWSTDEAALSDLAASVPLHHLYRRDMWLRGNVPIGNGYEGVWDAHEQVVWDAILPALRLASLLLNKSLEMPWLDALQRGRFNVIPREELLPRLENYKKEFSFHTRTQEEIMADHGLRDEYLRELDVELNMAIGSAMHGTECTMRNGRPVIIGGKGPNVEGITELRLLKERVEDEWNVDGIITTIHLHLLEPLLRSDLTNSERLAQQFYVATTLVHETMHSIGLWKRVKSGDTDNSFEPFFENEKIAELGYSWENSCFGGRVGGIFVPVPGDASSRPILGATIISWPDWGHFSNLENGTALPSGRFRLGEDFGPGAVSDRWAIRTSFIEGIQQASFWSTQVRSFGPDVLIPQKMVGRRLIRKNAEGESSQITIVGPDYKSWQLDSSMPVPAPDIQPTDDYATRWMKESQRSFRADAVRFALRRQQQGWETYKRDVKRVADWETRRENSTKVLSHMGRYRLDKDEEARVRVEVWDIETEAMEKREVMLRNQSLSPSEQQQKYYEAKLQEDKESQMLKDARQCQETNSEARAFQICQDILLESNSMVTRAHTHALLGNLVVTTDRKRHLQSAMATFQAMEALADKSQNWREYIQDCQAVLSKIEAEDREKRKEVRRGLQDQFLNGVELQRSGNESEAARIFVDLLKCSYVEIQARSHLMLAIMTNTPDKLHHTMEAKRRLEILQKTSPNQPEWAYMGGWEKMNMMADKMLDYCRRHPGE